MSKKKKISVSLNNDQSEEGGGWNILCYFKFCVYLRILNTFCCILMFVTFVNLFFVYLKKKKMKYLKKKEKKKGGWGSNYEGLELVNCPYVDFSLFSDSSPSYFLML